MYICTHIHKSEIVSLSCSRGIHTNKIIVDTCIYIILLRTNIHSTTIPNTAHASPSIPCGTVDVHAHAGQSSVHT